MLKPVIAAVCLGAATAAGAQTGLTGQQISDLIAGATVEIDTPAGTKLPVRYARDGKLSGDAGDLASYLGSATDSGRWWVTADQLCHRWSRWFNSEPQCMRLAARPDALFSGAARMATAAPHASRCRLPCKPQPLCPCCGRLRPSLPRHCGRRSAAACRRCTARVGNGSRPASAATADLFRFTRPGNWA